MKNSKPSLVLIAVGILAVPFAVHAQADYDYQSIAYPGADSVQIFGINNLGDAVGTGISATELFTFVYNTKKGTFVDVPSVSGYDSTAVLGISDNGTMVGSVTDEVAGTRSGLIIDKKGNATVFDHPDAATLTEARGVNNRGLVTGYRDSASGDRVGFIYHSKKHSFTDIVPSYFTIAQGVNSRGDVVGSALFDDASTPCPGPGPLHYLGWLRTADGNVTFFDVNGGSTRARGITDSGIIAGWVTDSTTQLIQGFVVELDGSQCQSISLAADKLLLVPGSNYTFVEGIKNSGEVVGQYEDAATGESFGYVASPN